MTTETMQRIEIFFNRDNESEGVIHYTNFDHIPASIVNYLIKLWKI